MFGMPKTLIVVYKDEMLMNQLEKLMMIQNQEILWVPQMILLISFPGQRRFGLGIRRREILKIRCSSLGRLKVRINLFLYMEMNKML